MSDIVEKWAEEEEAIAKSDIKSKIITLSIVFAIIIILIYLLVLVTAKSLSDGVRRVEGAIDNMSNGDFVTHLEVDSPIKEFKGIAVAAENMRHNLHEALKRIIASAKNVDDGANVAKEKIRWERSAYVATFIFYLKNGRRSRKRAQMAPRARFRVCIVLRKIFVYNMIR